MNTVVARAAHAWIGTPYLHRASLRGVGADCLGLVLGVWRDIGGAIDFDIPHYAPGWREPCKDEVLWEQAKALLGPAEREIAVGDIALLRMREGAVARHLGIISGTWREPRLIHAYSGRGVVESIIGKPLRRRFVARFRFPAE